MRSSHLQPGVIIDRYVIERVLGMGGFGAVYVALHSHLRQRVALKILHPELAEQSTIVERFFREARIAASLGHPHIIHVLDCGIASQGIPFLAMELLEGGSLDAVLDSSGGLHPFRAVTLASQVLGGLAAAHDAGVVHRDLKPANIFLTKGNSGAFDHPKILDFGVSKVHEGFVQKSLTRTGEFIGTPLYMAPEQFFGAHDVDARADLYSLAAIVYEMLVGRVPIDDESIAGLAYRVVNEPHVPLGQVAAHLPAVLASAVDRGLAKDRDARFANAAEFAAALNLALGSLGEGPRPSEEPMVFVATAPGAQERPAAQVQPSTHGQILQPGAGRGRSFPLALVVGVSALAAMIVVGALAVGYILGLRDEPRPAAEQTHRGAVPEPVLPVGPVSAVQKAPVQEPAPVPQPHPAITQPAAQAPPPIAVAFGPPRIVGSVDPMAVDMLLQGATTALEECQRQGYKGLTHVQLHIHEGKRGQKAIGLAQAHYMEWANRAAGQCCANAIKGSASEDWEGRGHGIVHVAIRLGR